MNEDTDDRLDAMRTQQGEGAAGLAPSAAGPAPAEEFEEQYQRIGRWKGPHGTREAQARVREFWLSQGSPGVRWLARRLREEGHVDVLHGASCLLWEAGLNAIPPILEELERQPAMDQADALLKALSWIGEDGVGAPRSLMARLEAALAGFLDHEAADVRESAALAMRLLPADRAAYWLRRRRPLETDPYVSETLANELLKK
jgi:hypothetical protein